MVLNWRGPNNLSSHTVLGVVEIIFSPPGNSKVQGTLDGGVESKKINGDPPRRKRCHRGFLTLKNESVGSKQD